MAKWFPLSGAAFIVLGVGLQISGYQNPTLAFVLFVAGVLMLIAPVLWRLFQFIWRRFFSPALQTTTTNPRVTYDEKTQIIEIFKNAPRVKVAITTLTSRAGEQFRSVMEWAAWLNDAFQKAGVDTQMSLWEDPENVPHGANIFWVKKRANNDMVRRIIKAAEVKGIYPREVSRPVSKDCEIDLMIGQNPYNRQ